MITKEQALSAREFHQGTCKITIGRMGGINIKVTKLRRNGFTQTWVTRPSEFRIPCKYGFDDYVQLTHRDAELVHLPDECQPLIEDNRSAHKQNECPFCTYREEWDYDPDGYGTPSRAEVVARVRSHIINRHHP